MVSSFPMKKNTATKIVFPILDADGDPVTGAAGLDSEYSLDGGSFADCASEATEIATTSGIYYLNLAAGETNGDVFCIQVKTSTSGAKTTVLVFYTATQTLDETDAIADAIKTKTDGLNFTGNYVQSQIKATDDIDFSATQNQSVTTDVWTAATRTLSDKTGFALSAAGIDAIHDEAVEGAVTLRQAIKVYLAALAGKSSGGGTTTLIFRDYADAKPRITATVDADGNRTAVTLDGT